MKIEGAIIGVGLLMLQRIPRGLLIPEGAIEDQYDPALQEFIDDVKTNMDQDFEPLPGFRQATIDHVKWFMEEKGLLK